MLTFDAPVLLLLLGGIIGARVAPDADAAWPLFLSLLYGLAIYGVTSVVCRYRPLAKVVVTGVVVVSLATALAFLMTASHEAYPDKVGIVTRLRLAIGSVAASSGGWTPFPASVAMALEGAVAVALSCAVAAHSRVSRWSFATAAAVIGSAVLLTESRGAWIAVASAVAILATWPSKPLRALAIVAALGVALTVAPVARGPVHEWALALASDAPFSGIGLRGFEFSLSQYVLLIQVPFLAYAHSLYLDAWLQLGLAGLAAVIWILTSTIVALATASERHRRSVSWWQTGCNLGVLTLLLHGTTDARPFIDTWCGALLFVLLGAGRGLAVMRDRTDAVARAGLGSPGESRLALSRIAESSAGLAAAVLTVAGVLLWTGSPRAAARTGTGAIRQARADFETRRQQGSSAVSAEIHAGRAEFESALQASPGHASAHYRLGVLLLQREQFAEARTHLDAAFRTAPGRPGTRKALGLAAMWTGDVTFAIEMLRADADMVNELNTWGAYRAERGETTLAHSAYSTSLGLNPDQPQIRSALDSLSAAKPPALQAP